MSNNFAPYQDAPEIERARSPPLKSPRTSLDYSRSSGAPRSPPTRPSNHIRNISEITSPLPDPNQFADNNSNGPGYQQRSSNNYNNTAAQDHRASNLEAFQQSIPMRLDYEAMAAYILLPPAGGVLLLLLEHKSDYVRFHAWQSSMLFTVVFIVHLVFSWSSVLSWMLFVVDVALIGFLARRAYLDVDTLEHYEVPMFGRIANRFVDDE